MPLIPHGSVHLQLQYRRVALFLERLIKVVQIWSKADWAILVVLRHALSISQHMPRPQAQASSDPFDPVAGKARCPRWRCDRGGDCRIHARSRGNPIQPADIALQEARGDPGAAQGFHSQGQEAGQAAGGGTWQEVHCPQMRSCCCAKRCQHMHSFLQLAPG